MSRAKILVASLAILSACAVDSDPVATAATGSAASDLVQCLVQCRESFPCDDEQSDEAYRQCFGEFNACTRDCEAAHETGEPEADY